LLRFLPKRSNPFLGSEEHNVTELFQPCLFSCQSGNQKPIGGEGLPLDYLREPGSPAEFAVAVEEEEYAAGLTTFRMQLLGPGERRVAIRRERKQSGRNRFALEGQMAISRKDLSHSVGLVRIGIYVEDG